MWSPGSGFDFDADLTLSCFPDMLYLILSTMNITLDLLVVMFGLVSVPKEVKQHDKKENICYKYTSVYTETKSESWKRRVKGYGRDYYLPSLRFVKETSSRAQAQKTGRKTQQPRTRTTAKSDSPNIKWFYLCSCCEAEAAANCCGCGCDYCWWS